ncbi:hypothetical protein AB6806_26820 [Bosea sp. RCC_152_1]|uniref:hypothetical protein n=1 Tax=Bosea sp. RCC_152_1 TaxID=3239228 RepID=UPI003526964A
MKVSHPELGSLVAECRLCDLLNIVLGGCLRLRLGLAAQVLGLVIPEFDRIAMGEPSNIANSGKPILPLHLRPFLLAGVAVVLESGPEMLDLLRRHAIGVRRELFDAFAAEAIAQWVSVRAHSQKQLI